MVFHEDQRLVLGRMETVFGAALDAFFSGGKSLEEHMFHHFCLTAFLGGTQSDPFHSRIGFSGFSAPPVMGVQRSGLTGNRIHQQVLRLVSH